MFPIFNCLCSREAHTEPKLDLNYIDQHVSELPTFLSYTFDRPKQCLLNDTLLIAHFHRLSATFHVSIVHHLILDYLRFHTQQRPRNTQNIIEWAQVGTILRLPQIIFIMILSWTIQHNN
jgi:hypothetical protein